MNKKNTLFINFKRFGDIFQHLATVDAYKVKNDDSNISILCFKEFTQALSVYKNFSEIYTLDRKKTLALRDNPLFGQGAALSEMARSIQSLTSMKWDEIICLSHDRFSVEVFNYLHRSTQTQEKTGMTVNADGFFHSTDIWMSMLDECCSEQELPVFDLATPFINSIGSTENTKGLKLTENPDYTKLCSENFQKIRRPVPTGGEVKLIGIQVGAGNAEKELKYDSVVNLIEKIWEDPNFYPVLLNAPTKKEREQIGKINEAFNNQIVTVECDFSACVSVMKNLDLIVTPDTSIKHLADLCNLPSIEYSFSLKTSLKHHSRNDGSILAILGNDRSIDNSNDLFRLIQVFFNDGLEEKVNFGPQTTVARIKRERNYISLRPIHGPFSPLLEERSVSQYCLIQINQDFEGFGQLPYKISRNVLEANTSGLVTLSRSLLNVLRPIVIAQESKSSQQKLVAALSNLIDGKYEGSLANHLAALFRAKLESRPKTKNQKLTLQQTEEALYVLKNDIQTCINLIHKGSSARQRVDAQTLG